MIKRILYGRAELLVLKKENTNELPNQFNLIVFWCERRYLLCSHGNGDIFSVFARKLTWYFIGVYIIKMYMK